MYCDGDCVLLPLCTTIIRLFVVTRLITTFTMKVNPAKVRKKNTKKEDFPQKNDAGNLVCTLCIH